MGELKLGTDGPHIEPEKLSSREKTIFPAKEILSATAILLAQAMPKIPDSRYEVTVHSKIDSLLPLTSEGIYKVPSTKPEDAGQYLSHVVGIDRTVAASIRSLLDSKDSQVPDDERRRYQALLADEERCKRVDVVTGYVKGRWGATAVAAVLAKFGQEATSSTQPRDIIFLITTNEKSKENLDYVRDLGKKELGFWKKRALDIYAFKDPEIKEVAQRLDPLVKLFKNAIFSNIINQNRLTAATLVQVRPNSIDANEAKASEDGLVNSLREVQKRVTDK